MKIKNEGFAVFTEPAILSFRHQKKKITEAIPQLLTLRDFWVDPHYIQEDGPDDKL